MIVKEHVAAVTQDRLKRAGDDAERQMAFYLRRAFADDARVHVFHNLRLEIGSPDGEADAAQIDHLVLHRHGAVIIESKSVTSAVRINERDEWTREWNGRWSGMPSPVLQARRQADFLRSVLRGRREELLSKAVFGLIQRGFGMFVFDVVVAISDQGVIQHRGQLPEVRKADQVADRVRELMQEQAGLSHLVSKDPRAKDWGMTLRPEELVRTSAFLRSAHRDVGAAAPARPVNREPEQPSGRHAAPIPRPAPTYQAVGPVRNPGARSAHPFRCQGCSGANLEITYGKYGYFFKCRDCDGNTRIELSCPSCSGRARTRKAGPQFYAECAGCSSSRLYFTNPH